MAWLVWQCRRGWHGGDEGADGWVQPVGERERQREGPWAAAAVLGHSRPMREREEGEGEVGHSVG